MIEIGAPASLPLGVVQVEQNHNLKTCLLGLTLQHPPVHLSVRASNHLKVTSAPADKGYEQALEVWGFDRGGLLLVDTRAQGGTFPEFIRRGELHTRREMPEPLFSISLASP